MTISGGTIGNTSGNPITLSTNNAQTWNGNFTFAGPNDLNLGAGPVTLNGNRTVTVASNNLTVGGPISGSGSLTKAGLGTLILDGPNTYTGPTAVAAGTLALLPARINLLHYTFDASTMSGTTAGSTVTNVSGNGHSGTIYGSPTSTTGRFGQAIAFASGPNVYGSYVEASPSPAFNVNNYTVSAWINIPSTAASSSAGGCIVGPAQRGELRFRRVLLPNQFSQRHGFPDRICHRDSQQQLHRLGQHFELRPVLCPESAGQHLAHDHRHGLQRSCRTPCTVTVFHSQRLP